MTRPLRIQFENAHYHVTCRGNARQKIFLGESDRRAFLELLVRSTEIYQIEILAYVLMPNHFHLLVKTPLGNLQEFMRHFNISYTSYFNRTHDRSGHMYQGRYKAFLIDADRYLQGVSRYIHLNPVRIRGASRKMLDAKRGYLKSYRWSSYPGYLSSRKRESFLGVNGVLGYFGGDTLQGRRRYERFVSEGLSGELESPLERGRGHGIVGEKDFIERIREQHLSSSVRSRELPALKRIVAQVEPEKILWIVCRELGVEKEELIKRGSKGVGRGLLMELLYRYGGMNQREIGEFLGIDYSAVSVGRKRCQGMVEKDRKLFRQMERIKAQVCER